MDRNTDGGVDTILAMIRHWPLIVILAVYFGLGAMFAVRIPAWQMPDEPAHYNYIKQLSATGRIPVIENGDWIVGFSPPGPDKRDLDIAPLTYEDHQPPLFYVLATPVFQLSGGSVTALRLFSLSVGALTIVFAYLVAVTIFSNHAHLAAFAATFVGLVPQHLFMMSGINNDALAEALLAATVWQSVRLICPGQGLPNWQKGLLALTVAACFWTKATAYLALPVALYAMLVTCWNADARWHKAWSRIWRVCVIAGLLGLPWWLHNIQVYGGLDFLGLQRHNAVVIGQPTTAEWIAQFGFGGVLMRLFQTTFQSFWGQFGWMSVLFDARLYVLLLFLTLASAGLFVAWWAYGARSGLVDRPGVTGTIQFSPWAVLTEAQSKQLTLLAVLTVLTLLAFAWYNLQFVQHQGRYLFPALIPIGMACALGWGFAVRNRPVLLRWLWLGPLIGLAGVNLYALFRVMLPQMGA
jgi:4-amino-4-deoxy-L-arabinose transferase-like glycosyltransferase